MEATLKQDWTERLHALANEHLLPELVRRGIRFGPWETQTKRQVIGSRKTYWFSFWLIDQEHVVTVAEIVNMHANDGRSLFECEDRDEFTDESSHFRFFMDRLGNYLDHGEWVRTRPPNG